MSYDYSTGSSVLDMFKDIRAQALLQEVSYYVVFPAILTLDQLTWDA